MRYYIYEVTYGAIKGGTETKILRVSSKPLGRFVAALESERTVTASCIREFSADCEAQVRAILKEEVSRRNVLGTYFCGKQKYVVPRISGKKRLIFEDFADRWAKNYCGDLKESFERTCREFGISGNEVGIDEWNKFWELLG